MSHRAPCADKAPKTITLTDASLVLFFNDTPTTEIYTLSLHDALPISHMDGRGPGHALSIGYGIRECVRSQDRKSTRLNSRHRCISYAVFCLKKRDERRGPGVRKGGPLTAWGPRAERASA